MPVLSIFNYGERDNMLPLVLDEDKAFCTHKYGGIDELQFEIYKSDNISSFIKEEVYVEAFNNCFVVKNIDEHSDFITVKCIINLEDWESKILINYRKTNETIANVLQRDLLPTGWAISWGSGVDTSIRRTIEESEGNAYRAATPLEILDGVSSIYSVVFGFDVINKIVYVINPNSFQASQEFLMQDFNLLDFGFNGNSESFATRLYVYGKKDEQTGEYLTIASVNDGLDYVDNHDYSDKIIITSWVDERYTIPEELKSAAIEKLNELAIPKRSYTGNVKNFNRDISLYKIVILIDADRNVRVEHQVIEYVEYEDSSLDSCTLSSEVPTIQNEFKKLSESVNSNISNAKSDLSQSINDEVRKATDIIMGSQGGHFKWIVDQYGNPQKLLCLLDSEDIDVAQKVIRWDETGIAYSQSGYGGQYTYLSQNGKIKASEVLGLLSNVSINIGDVFKVSELGILQAVDVDISGILKIGGNNNSIGKVALFNSTNQQIGEFGINGIEAPEVHASNGYSGTIRVNQNLSLVVVDGIITQVNAS